MNFHSGLEFEANCAQVGVKCLEKIEKLVKRKERVVEEPEESFLKRQKFENCSGVSKKVDPHEVFASIVGDSMKEFPMPKPRTIKRVEAANGIKPIVARPITAWPIAARPLNVVPSEPMTPSSFKSEEDSLVNVAHILEDIAARRGKVRRWSMQT